MLSKCWHHSLPSRQLTHHLLSLWQQEKGAGTPPASAQVQGPPRQGCNQEQGIFPAAHFSRCPSELDQQVGHNFSFGSSYIFSKLLLPGHLFLYLWRTLIWERGIEQGPAIPTGHPAGRWLPWKECCQEQDRGHINWIQGAAHPHWRSKLPNE